MRRTYIIAPSLLALASACLIGGLAAPAPLTAEEQEEAAPTETETLAALFEAYDASRLDASPTGKA